MQPHLGNEHTVAVIPGQSRRGIAALALLLATATHLLAQLFWPSGLLADVTQILLMPLPYLAAFALLLVLCSPGAGVLLAPVIIYGLALMMMAILSTGLGPIAGFGGAIFFLSDSLIALRSFADIDVPGMGFWIMLTYVAGQWMISYAASQREAQEKSTVKCE